MLKTPNKEEGLFGEALSLTPAKCRECGHKNTIIQLKANEYTKAVACENVACLFFTDLKKVKTWKRK